MSKKMRRRLGMIAVPLLLLLLAVIVWQLLGVSNFREPLSEAEVKQMAEERFNGKMTDIELANNIYDMTIKLETGKYRIKIDRSSGDVLEIIRTEKAPIQKFSEEEIRGIIQKEQTGEIKKLKKRIDNQVVYYDAIVENSKNKTSMTINGETGEVIKTKEEKKQPPKEVTKNITEAEAIEIALDTVHGKVDDVELESSEGQLYYFVEIELDDDREANIQIHAITGEAKIIEWDE
ncbi:PepSY domain-containing protein [Lederbergia sp. NSJ-179]|uniref:PepSY domain-containing protein n=1 Tax=Lederbergia sp. NSJ-179 TaxID=2931402 RepID=UPI001FD29DE6|nr:PepSY domain-containing protein [Lederbergia sp. NSJ-179]MCJ7842481.1 PepSY domain-containing protein [Lederbergia sp. NSJ-179]